MCHVVLKISNYIGVTEDGDPDWEKGDIDGGSMRLSKNPVDVQLTMSE